MIEEKADATPARDESCTQIGRKHNKTTELEPEVQSEASESVAVDGQEESLPVDQPVRLGPYKLLRPLGQGGMGVVYLAEQCEPVKRRVALKVVHTALRSEQGLLLFGAERQALARLSHPNVAQMFEADTTEDGRPYFVMELVEGQPITRYCDERRLGLRDRLRLFRTVCGGVQHAHQKGILHRDLKPSNVLVTEIDGHPVPKIIDFGIATAIDEPLMDATPTGSDRAIGTPVYMSPEALGGGLDLDTRSDVYSLGVMLYELLVGGRPYEEKGLQPMRRRIAEDKPSRPSCRLRTLDHVTRQEVAHRRRIEERALNRWLKGDLDWVVMRAVARDRDERYGSPAELSTDIGRHLNHEPVEAHPSTAFYHVRKFIRRRRGVVATAALLIVSLAWGLVARTLQARRAEREARVATEVSEFLVGLFEVSDPSEARGNTVTAKEILDKGAERIQRGLNNQPLVQARMMDTMGRVYRALGLYGPAEPLLVRALELRRHHLGPKNLDVSETLNNLAVLLKAKGDYEQAEPLYREALAVRRLLLGNDCPEVAQSLSNLASFLTARGDYEGAETHYREALAIFRRALGEENEDVARALDNLGGLLHRKGNDDDAEPLLREALAMRRNLLGEAHPEIAVSLNNLATLVYAKGDYDGAVELLRESLAMNRRVYGSEHPEVARSLNNLGVLLYRKDDYDNAEPLFREALEIRRRVLGDDHPHVALSLDGLAIVLDHKGDKDGAETLYREALAIRRRVLGDEHPEVAVSLNNVGMLLYIKGDLDAAEPVLREALAVSRRALGEEHPNVARIIGNLAGLLQDRGDYDEAEALFRQALTMRRHVLGDDHRDVADSLKDLAVLLAARGRFTEAAELAYGSLEVSRRALPEGSWRIAHVEGVVGVCLTGLGRYAEAESLLLAALPVVRQDAGERSAATRDVLKWTANLYDAWGDQDKAAEYRELLDG
jgi:serine/threonine protein kinase/tetratricopeptide (TPR) repeat protein